MDRNELFEKWMNSLDIPLMAWQKEILRLACTHPNKELYINMPRNHGRHLVMKLVEQYEQMLKEKNMESKNLTKVIKHPYFKREAAVYERDDKKWGEHVITRTPGNGPEYLAGPVVDRLHEFEKLGYEPEELEKIIAKYKQWKTLINSAFGKCAFNYQDTDSLSKKRNDAVDTLYYMCKLAGDVENAQCNDIRSLYPSMLYTKDGFRELYATSEKFKKMMDDRIVEAILKPVKYQKVTMKIADLDRPNRNGSIIRTIRDIDEMHTVPADDGWLETCIKPTLSWKHFVDREIGKVNNVEQTKEGVKVTVTKNPEYQFKIKRVLFNNPATIVFWADGEKTVVKCQNGEPYDPEKGLAMAISKKALGNDRAYYDEFQKQLGRGQKYSTPEQFNSEVCHMQKLEDLMAAEEDNKTNRALAADALDYLKKAFINPKSTKTDLMRGMAKAMDCVNAILDNY